MNWLTLFAAKPDPRFDWDHSRHLTGRERTTITASLQQFQLGEGSDGNGLFRRAEQSAAARTDRDFVPALRLFVKEEQRHSRDLARFMAREGIPCLREHWVDHVFRRLRKLAGLELCLTVLATAEVIAVPYYTALARATESPLLQSICTRILDDEADHLRFQASMLGRLRASRRQRPVIERILRRMFVMTTLAVVWREHGRVFRAGGYTWRRFRAECIRLDNRLHESNANVQAPSTPLLNGGATHRVIN